MSRYLKYIFIVAFFAAPNLSHAATISFGDKSWDVNPTTLPGSQTALVRSIDLPNLTKHILLGDNYRQNIALFDADTLDTVSQIEAEVNQPVVDAQLVIQDNWATTFVPDQDGQSVDIDNLADALLLPGVMGITLPVQVSQPSVRLGDLNNLGIKELVATGESDYSGSTKNRIVNVTVGSSKYNGLILAPGEEFSFNKYLGEVDADHGFKPELVIKASGVTPEFGGGLCQVSSTMFRAAMNAGFPITARRNHSFAVHYYSPQGTDATIYPGVQDMKYINNLSSSVLIRTRMDTQNNKLYFDFYGTKDDRAVTFDGPTQYDRKPDGSLKATWTRHVTLNGQTTTQTFNSNYQPPALFEQTTQVATPNPQAQSTPANTPATETPTPTT